MVCLVVNFLIVVKSSIYNSLRDISCWFYSRVFYRPFHRIYSNPVMKLQKRMISLLRLWSLTETIFSLFFFCVFIYYMKVRYRECAGVE